MLTKNKLLIDKGCPMCQLYAKGFEKARLIDKDTVSFYQTTEAAVFEKVDAERAKSEVALVNTDTGEVMYGARAFTAILSQNRIWLKRFFQWSPIAWIIEKLYRFISYNRHVITGPSKIEGIRSCTPPLNVFYRWLYLFFVAVFTGVILNQFAFHLMEEIGWSHYWWREFIICFVQIVWQGMSLYKHSQKKRLDYLGNMSTISLIGALLLAPLLILNGFIDLSAFVLIGYFMVVVSIMLVLHIRRSSQLDLPLTTTVSWVLYRTVCLSIIIITN